MLTEDDTNIELVTDGILPPEGEAEQAPQARAATTESITRDEILERSQSWIDERVPYSQSAYHSNKYGRYRTDCSGYVSMCWNLDRSHTTATIMQIAERLSSKDDLKPGDALWYRSGRAGHIALFVGWKGNDPVVREMARPGTRCREVAWRSKDAARYVPIRFDHVTEKPQRPAARIFGAGNGVLYARDADGRLFWYRHLDSDGGDANWAHNGQPRTVGSGWGHFPHVTATSDGVLYAVRPDGALCWYRHLGSDGGEAKWAHDGQPQIIGSGWQQFTHVMAAGDGIIYGVRPDGTLSWYRHLDPNGGEATWANDGQPKVIGSGWQQFTHLVAALDGVVYATRPDGALVWYRHLGAADGTATWAGDGQPAVIGSGWQQFTHVINGGAGALYTQRPDGNLLWYRHLTPLDGNGNWANNGQPKVIGSGWTY